MKLITLFRAHHIALVNEMAWEQLLFSTHLGDPLHPLIEKYYIQALKRRKGIESRLAARLKIIDGQINGKERKSTHPRPAQRP